MALLGVCGALHERVQKMQSLTCAQDPPTTAISPSPSLRTRVVLGHPAALEANIGRKAGLWPGTVFQTGVRNKGRHTHTHWCTGPHIENIQNVGSK